MNKIINAWTSKGSTPLPAAHLERFKAAPFVNPAKFCSILRGRRWPLHLMCLGKPNQAMFGEEFSSTRLEHQLLLSLPVAIYRKGAKK